MGLYQESFGVVLQPQEMKAIDMHLVNRKLNSIVIGISGWTYWGDKPVFNYEDWDEVCFDPTIIKEKEQFVVYNPTDEIKHLIFYGWYNWDDGDNEEIGTLYYQNNEFEKRQLWVNPDLLRFSPFWISRKINIYEFVYNEEDDAWCLDNESVKFVVPHIISDYFIEFEEVENIEELKRCLVAV